MSNSHYLPSTRQLLCIAAALLLCLGVVGSASGQEPKFPSARTNRSSDPETYVRSAASRRANRDLKPGKSRPAQPSTDTPPNPKQQEIEKALEDGNQARKLNEYEQALAHYKVAQKLSPQEARAFYGMGNLYSDLYCYDSALAAYLKALKFKKDYLEAHLALGYVYINKERYDEAGEQFQAVLNIKKDNAEAIIGSGYVYVKKGKYPEAITQIKRVIDAKSVEVKDRAAAHIALGAVYEKQNKQQESIQQYEKAISLKPDLAAAYIQLGDAQLSSASSKLFDLGFGNMNDLSAQELEAMGASAKQAIANLERAKGHGYNHPNIYLLMGKGFAYQFRYQDAVTEINRYFDKLKELEQGLSPLAKECNFGFNQLKANGYWFLGFVYSLEAEFEADNQRKTALYDKAIKQLKDATGIKQDFVNAYWMTAIIYSKQEKHHDAISQYQNAIRYGIEESARARLYNGLGLAYSWTEHKDEALTQVQEAIELEPTNPTFYETLATIYVTQGKIEETFAALKKANDLRTTPPTNPSPYYFLGGTYAIRFMNKRDEQDFVEAIKWLKKAAEIKPKHAMYHHALGMTYKAHADADEALASYKKAAAYDTTNPRLYYDMADIYSNLKQNNDAAIEALKKSVEVKPDYGNGYRFLGVLYQRKGNSAEAVKQLQKAIEVEPKLLQAYIDLAHVYRTQKNYPEAIKHLEKAIEIAPTSAEPYREMAKIYNDQRKTDEAIRYYKEAINRLKADDTSSKNLYLGRIARLQGQYAESISYFQKLQFPEGPGQIHYEIGMTYVESKNKSAALEQHQQLVQLKSPLAKELAEDLLKKIQEMK